LGSVIDREGTLPHLVVEPAAAHERHQGADDPHDRHDHHKYRQPAVHLAYSVPMWRRLRRRSMAPSRPAVYPDQVGLLIFSLLAIGAGLYLAARALFG
jgi:hypothetical protein